MFSQWIVWIDILAGEILHTWNKSNVIRTLSLIQISGFGLLIVLEFCIYADVSDQPDVRFFHTDCSRLLFLTSGLLLFCFKILQIPLRSSLRKSAPIGWGTCFPNFDLGWRVRELDVERDITRAQGSPQDTSQNLRKKCKGHIPQSNKNEWNCLFGTREFPGLANPPERLPRLAS